jgi:hypothetical protein
MLFQFLISCILRSAHVYILYRLLLSSSSSSSPALNDSDLSASSSVRFNQVIAAVSVGQEAGLNVILRQNLTPATQIAIRVLPQQISMRRQWWACVSMGTLFSCW